MTGQNGFLRLAAVLVALALTASCAAAQAPARVSEFGRYGGYGEPVYKEWIRSSQYVAVRDGTRLAVDIIRPAVDGKAVEKPLPVLWTHNRYQRARRTKEGAIRTLVDGTPWLQEALKRGYVIANVDVRGGGASFGVNEAPFSEKETRDAYDVTEWLAAQPWSDGKIGMFGISYLGITQYMAASEAPPHLKAIFPEKALFDMYDFVYGGGIFRHDFLEKWGSMVKSLDNRLPTIPVDDDRDGALAAAAVGGHAANWDVTESFRPLPFRDSVYERAGKRLNITRSPSTYLDAIRRSGVAVYHWAGWMDVWPRDQLLWYRNLTNPQRITIGPWSHQQTDDAISTAEHLRWFDYWLKGVDNGIMREAPIHYFTMGAGEGRQWRSARQWPLPDERRTPYYFADGGLLATSPLLAKEGKDVYKVDYGATSGKPSRWSNGYGDGGDDFEPQIMTANDAKALTYTSAPLDRDLEVTGHPVAHLWVTASGGDADFIVYLEDVDEAGVSRYVTEGALRASHRATSTPPYDRFGLPYHRSYEDDAHRLPSGPVRLDFDLHPTSQVFRKGHRLRVAIVCADRDNVQVRTYSGSVSIYRNASHKSHVDLPVIP